jgi:alkylated DNA repair protein (DNA oxidative demethylase)
MQDSNSLWAQNTELTVDHLVEGFTLLRAFCINEAPELLDAIEAITHSSPFRHMTVPSGHTMSVAMTNCGDLGWITDRTGYRYASIDPTTSKPWPALPLAFRQLALQAAAKAGYPDFITNACLINRYEPGSRLSLHQDRNEQDYTQPIVSVSLGLPATFLLGTLRRNDTPRRIRVEHGDVAVWGGPARLIYHGVAPIAQGTHPLTGACRINLTFRHVAR